MGDIEDVGQLELVTTCSVQLDITDSCGIYRGATESLDRVTWDGFEDLEV